MYLVQDLSAGNGHLLGTGSDWFRGHVGTVGAYLKCRDLCQREERLRLQARAWYCSTLSISVYDAEKEGCAEGVASAVKT